MIVGALLAAALSAAPSASEPAPVLYRKAGTRRLVDLLVDEETRAAAEASCRTELPQPPGYDPAVIYPVSSPSLALGRLGAPDRIVRKVERRPGMKPVFLIGDDAASLRWLAGNRAALKELGALGMVVEVASRERFEAITRLAPDLPIVAMSGEAVASEMRVSHYPVLISPRGVHQ